MVVQVQESKIKLVEYLTKSLSFTPFAIKWLPGSASLIACGQTHRTDGVIQLFDLQEGSLSQKTTTELKAGVKACTFGGSENSMHMAIGSFRGEVSLYDIEAQSVCWDAKEAHDKIVNAVDACGSGSTETGPREIVSASRDGQAKIWDVREHKPIAVLKQTATKADCWAASFGNSFNGTDRCVVTGYDNGDVKMLDLRSMRIRWETQLPSGVCHVSFDRKDIQMNKLMASCLDGFLHVFDARTYHPQSGFASYSRKVTNSTIWGCHPIPHDREIMGATTGDGSLYMLKYHYPFERKIKDSNGLEIGVAGDLQEITSPEKLASQPIVAFDWNGCKKGLCACASLDETLRVIYCLGI